MNLYQCNYLATGTGVTAVLFEEAYLTSTHVNMKWEMFLQIYMVHF